MIHSVTKNTRQSTRYSTRQHIRNKLHRSCRFLHNLSKFCVVVLQCIAQCYTQCLSSVFFDTKRITEVYTSSQYVLPSVNCTNFKFYNHKSLKPTYLTQPNFSKNFFIWVLQLFLEISAFLNVSGENDQSPFNNDKKNQLKQGYRRLRRKTSNPYSNKTQ